MATQEEAIAYKEYLARVAALAKRVDQPSTGEYPVAINSSARRALYDNLKDIQLPEDWFRRGARRQRLQRVQPKERALALDDAIRRVKKDDWRGNRFKKREVRQRHQIGARRRRRTRGYDLRDRKGAR